ncbi:MAG: SUKH-3 domain-containing protein [Actinocatenispora sp.]
MADKNPWLYWRPPTEYAEVEPVMEWDGYHFPGIVARMDAATGPQLYPGQERITDAEERDRLVAYLTGAPVLHNNRFELSINLFHVDAGPVIPSIFYTDGSWIWGRDIAHHLMHDHLGPKPEFYQHIKANGYQLPELTDEEIDRARQALYASGREEERRRGEYERKRYLEDTPPYLVRGEASNEPPTIPEDPDKFDQVIPPDNRFTIETQWSLEHWHPGRDASARIDPWLDKVERETGLVAHAAARAILHEFGLLDLVPEKNWGEIAIFPVNFLPLENVNLHPHTLRNYLAFGNSLGGHPVFPVAHTIGDYPGQPHVVAADDLGRVFLLHETGESFLGENIDAALEVLTHGLEPPLVQRGGTWTPRTDLPNPADEWHEDDDEQDSDD